MPAMPQMIEWKDGFSVGDPGMDRQHRRLLQLCNELAICAEDGAQGSDAAFHRILNELAIYARTHFADEEKLLDRTGYSDLASHRDDHGNYESDLTDFMFSACLGELDKPAVHRFVLAWWLRHILKSDMAYRDHLLALEK